MLTAYQWIAHVSMNGFHLADSELTRLHRRDRKGTAVTFDVPRGRDPRTAVRPADRH